TRRFPCHHCDPRALTVGGDLHSEWWGSADVMNAVPTGSLGILKDAPTRGNRAIHTSQSLLFPAEACHLLSEDCTDHTPDQRGQPSYQEQAVRGQEENLP